MTSDEEEEEKQADNSAVEVEVEEEVYMQCYSTHTILYKGQRWIDREID